MAMIRETMLKRLLLPKIMAGGGGGAPVQATATGNPVVFETDLARPLKSLLINLLPLQSGTGDPSPDNVRPIVPWDGLKVCGAGGNLIDASQLQDGYVWWNGNKIGGYAPNCVSPLIPVKAGSTYYRQGRTASQNEVSFFDKDKAFLSQAVIQPPVSFTVPNGACYAGFTFSKEYKNEAMINVGSSAMPYEEYKPITETDISFPSPVYGGTLDVVSGVLTVTHEGLVSTWGQAKVDRKQSGYQQGRMFFTHDVPVSGQSGASATNQKCNIAKYQWDDFNGTPHFYTGTLEGRNCAVILIPEDTPDETEIVVSAKLRTTYEVQLTPEQITAINGANTIWTDGNGDIEVTYLKKA